MQVIDKISLKQQKQLKPSYTPAAFRTRLEIGQKRACAIDTWNHLPQESHA